MQWSSKHSPNGASSLDDFSDAQYDSEWDAILGWPEEESEWDDASKWNDASGQPSSSSVGSRGKTASSAHATKSVVDWAREEPDVSAKILLCLLDGMTPSQAAIECNIPKNSVDALLSYGLARKPVLQEDQYAHVYETYAISLNEFIDIFGQPARTYRYLTLAYKPGKSAIEGMLGDRFIPVLAKHNLKRRLKRLDSQQPVDTPRVKDEESSPKKELPKIDSSYASRVIAKTDISLLNLPQTKVSAPKVRQDIPSKSKVQRKTLLHKEKASEKPRSSTALRTKNVIPERSENELEQLRDAVLGIAKRDTEYSVKHFYIKLSGLMSEMGILSPRQLYDELTQAFMRSPDVELCENLLIRFGNADHNKQILSLIKDLSVSNPSRIAWLYRDQYGVDFPLIRKWLLDFSDYQNDSGMYDYEFGQLRRGWKGLRNKDDKPAVRQAQAGSVTVSSGTKSNVKATRAGSRSATVISESEKERLRSAVLRIAEEGSEYSTVFFYRALPEIADELRVTTSFQFNSLFTEAFRDYAGVSLTSIYLVEFGSCDKKRQLLRLMNEMSPVHRADLCREYEKRYGVSGSTVNSRLKRFAEEYRRGDVYSTEYGPELTKSGAVSSREAARKSAVLRRLRKAIYEQARIGIEYSTDHFYTTLPQFVVELNVKSETEFYRVVKEAFKDSFDVTFSTLHAMSIGTTDRDSQILALMREMSPVTGEDLSREYERRYGFSWYLVKWWLRKFSEYESDGLYRTGPSEEAVASEKTVGSQPEKAANENKVELVDVSAADDSIKLRVVSPKGADADTEDVDALASKTEKKVEMPRLRKVQPSKAPSQMTALDWALSLDGVTRQVVQQILFGNRLSSVAERAKLSPDETTYILLDAFLKCPTVKEDAFLLSYRLYKDAQDFCVSTGQPEATYYFLCWRTLARENHPSETAPQPQAQQTSGSITKKDSGREDAASRRRRLRAQARAERKQGRLNLPELLASLEKEIEEEERGGVSHGGSEGSSMRTPNSINTTPASKLNESKSHLERQMTYEVNRLAKLNKEYAAAFFFNALPDLMAKYDIKSDRDLFAYLRRAYRRDPDVTFLGNDVIRFGKCNRSRQVNQFCLERPYLDIDTFVKEYGAQYGFDAMRVTKWVDKYHLDLLPSKRSRAIQIDSHQIRRAHAVAAQKGSEYESFLRSELNGDCCDRRLIAERFRAKFPDGPDDPFTQEVLDRLGYKPKGKKLLFKKGVNPYDYFDSLIGAHTMFARGDRGFENAVFNDPQFRQVLRRRMRSYDVIEYEKDSFIDTCHLCEQMGVSIDDVFSYSQDVTRQLREIQGVPVPFTIWSLRNRYHIQHPLDVLATEGGMSDFLFETLFDIDPHVQYCSLAGKRGFLESEGAFDTSNFIECLIEMNGPMEFDDLLYLLKDAYGIDYHELPLHHTISMSSLYYDDITDSVFNSRHEWEEMVNRELA